MRHPKLPYYVSAWTPEQTDAFDREHAEELEDFNREIIPEVTPRGRKLLINALRHNVDPEVRATIHKLLGVLPRMEGVTYTAIDFTDGVLSGIPL